MYIQGFRCCRTLRSVEPSTVFITEIMYNPKHLADDSSEWLEFYNPSYAPIDIEGWEIAFRNHVHSINDGGDGAIVSRLLW